MKAIVLCAGFGMRLRPLTDRVAKPLIDVAGRPIVDYVMEKAPAPPEIDEIYLVCNGRFHGDFGAWKAARSWPVQPQLFNDGVMTNDERLGAVGDMLFVAREAGLRDDFLVLGGDNIFTADLAGLIEQFRRKGNSLPLYDVADIERAKKLGVVTLAGDGRVAAVYEKPERPPGTLVSICAYMYSASVVGRLEEYAAAGKPMDNSGSFAGWLCGVEEVYGWPMGGVWFDIGTHESLEEARDYFTRGAQGE